ncbi:MAG TPA: DNA polymerase III subunit delta' [Usitatibacter sp.]|nr:DNA polymerase III subunit delta' [Usitatibacter sp.]
MNAYPWHEATLARLLADRTRLPHALLVQGPTGIGKTAFARALAAGVLCEAPRDGLACGSCPSCHWFSQGNHPDYREVVPEAAAEEEPEPAEGEAARTDKAEKAKSLVIKIEQIRDVADFVALTTHRAGYRVLVIRPAETLHPAAANALLKTLEEPPPHTLIVLVSDRPSRLLPTIRSRCRALVLDKPPREAALRWLRAEGVEGPEAALAAAGGAPLLARELAQPEEAELRRRIVAELSRPGGADPLTFAATVDRAGVERFLYWMQTWVYDLLRVRLAGDARHHGESAAALRARAQKADVEALLALERELVEARRLASHPLNARLLAEHLLLAYNRATLEAHR